MTRPWGAGYLPSMHPSLVLRFSLILTLALPAWSAGAQSLPVPWETLLPRIAAVEPRGLDEVWTGYLEFPDGTFKHDQIRMTLNREGPGFKTVTDDGDSRLTLTFQADGQMLTMRTEFLSTDLASWNQADLLLAEYQPEAHNLAFERALNNQVKDASNQEWGPGWMDFSALPPALERLVRSGFRGQATFRNYIRRAPCRLLLQVWETDRPLEAETRYSYPRWFRENLGHRKVVLVKLTSAPDSQGAYPYPFFYAFVPGRSGYELEALWGGQVKEAQFQYREPRG